MPAAAGGLVGFLGFTSNVTGSGSTTATNCQMSSITDCYATGDVTADNPNADNAAVYSGGLAGYVQIDATKAVTRSFASGTVSAKNASSGAGAQAGGIVGYKALGQLSQCVAAGRPGRQVSVSAQGGNNRYVGRVYGQSAGTAPANNYANKAIYIGTDASYYAYPPLFTVVINELTFSPTPAAGNENGLTKTNADFSTAATWTNTPLSFLTSVWNFAPVAQGYPKLVNVGGQ